MVKKLRGGFLARFQDLSMYTPNSDTARMNVTPSCRSSSLSSLSSRSIMFRQPSFCRESYGPQISHFPRHGSRLPYPEKILHKGRFFFLPGMVYSRAVLNN